MNALQQQINDAAEAAEAAAAAAYREILERSNAPHDGDAEKLEQVMAVLKLTSADLASDLRARQEVAELVAKMPTEEQAAKLSEKFNELTTALHDGQLAFNAVENDFLTKKEEWFQRRNELRRQVGEAGNAAALASNQLTYGRQDVASIKHLNPRAF